MENDSVNNGNGHSLLNHNIGEIFDRNKIVWPNTDVKEKRVFDYFDRDTVGPRLEKFIQHCVAKKVEPSLNVILDFLYSNKHPSEPDDFVPISRMIEMVKSGQSFPLLLLEVLDYAKRVESAAARFVKFIEMNAIENELPEDYAELKDLLKYTLKSGDYAKNETKGTQNG